MRDKNRDDDLGAYVIGRICKLIRKPEQKCNCDSLHYIFGLYRTRGLFKGVDDFCMLPTFWADLYRPQVTRASFITGKI
jgi:hypothetical protein